MTRDLSKREFDAACKRENFTPGFWGFYDLACGGVMVNVLNAGPRWRDRLAYLMRERSKWQEKIARETAARKNGDPK